MGDCSIAWSFSIHSIKSGSQVYDSFLEEFPLSHGDIVDDEHNFSSSDGRSIKEDHLDVKGCYGHASLISRVAGKSIYP